MSSHGRGGALLVGMLLVASCSGKEERTPAPEPPAPAPIVLPDRPLGGGPCRFVSEREVSQVVGVAMRYRPVEPDDVACVLRPDGAQSGDTIGDRLTTVARAPEVTVSHTDKNGDIEWDFMDYQPDDMVAGIGDRAAVTSSILGGGSSMAMALKGPRILRAEVTWAERSEPEREKMTVDLLRLAMARFSRSDDAAPAPALDAASP